MRIALTLAIALGLVATTARADIPPPRLERPKPAKVKRAPGPTRLVGELVEDGVERCLPNWQREWVNRYPVVGFTPLKPAAGVDAKALFGQLVVVTGELDPAGRGRLPPVVHTGECPQEQMRSDWVHGPSGMRMMRSGMGTLGGAFSAKRIASWSGLQLSVEGDELVVVLTNTFGVALVAPTIRVHYEGCFGKPGTTERTAAAPELAAGAQLTFRAPLVVRDEGRPDGRRTFHASSVQIATSPTSVAFDLDRGLHRAGIAAACPKDAGEE